MAKKKSKKSAKPAPAKQGFLARLFGKKSDKGKDKYCK